jgi:hypothetical protein
VGADEQSAESSDDEEEEEANDDGVEDEVGRVTVAELGLWWTPANEIAGAEPTAFEEVGIDESGAGHADVVAGSVGTCTRLEDEDAVVVVEERTEGWATDRNEVLLAGFAREVVEVASRARKLVFEVFAGADQRAPAEPSSNSSSEEDMAGSRDAEEPSLQP